MTDAVNFAQTFKNQEKISENVCLMFGELYLQKCEKYFGEDAMPQTYQFTKNVLIIPIKTHLVFIFCMNQEKFTLAMML